MEELKLLQTAILLITTSPVVQHEALAKVDIAKPLYNRWGASVGE